MEKDKKSSRLKKSKKKTNKNESSKTISGEIDRFIDSHGIKAESYSDTEIDHAGENLKRVSGTDTQASEDAPTPKRNRTETDISSERIGMPGNTSITCENPRPVSVVHKTEINKYPVFIVQKLQSDKPLGSPTVNIVSSGAVEKTLKMSPSSLSSKTSRRPFARKILPATLKMETYDTTSASAPVKQYCQRKQKNTKMYVKRVPLQKKIEGLTKKNLQKHLEYRANIEPFPSKSTVETNQTDFETSPISLNTPEAIDTKHLESGCPRPVLLVQNKSFNKNKKQMYKIKNSVNNQPTVNQDTDPQSQNKAALISDSEMSIKTEPEDIKTEMSKPLWTGDEREKERESLCGQREKGPETNVRKDLSSETVHCEFQFSEEMSKSGATTSVSTETTKLYSIQLHHSQPKSIFSKTLSVNMSVVSSAPKDTSKSIVSTGNTPLTNPGVTASNFSPTIVSTTISKSSVKNCPLLAPKDSSTHCVRRSGTNSELSTNNAAQETAGLQKNVTNVIQGTVLETQCQSTTGMKLVTIPQKTITSTRTKCGSKSSKVFELMCSPLIRSTQPNHMMLPRFPNGSPGLRHPAPFIYPPPDANITRAANTTSSSQQILGSVSDPNMILNQTSTAGAGMSSQNLLISPPSLPQGPGILTNSMFDQSLGGYRLGNIIIKTQNIGHLPQSAASTTLSPSVTSNLSTQNPNQTFQGTSIQNMTSRVPVSAQNSVRTIPSSTIQGSSIQTMMSQVPTPAYTTPGAIPSSTIQGSTGNTSSPVFSFQSPQGQAINQNKVLGSPMIHYPFFSHQSGSIVNPGLNQGQGMVLNPNIQTFNQQVPSWTEPVTNQQVHGTLTNFAFPGGNQQVPGAVPNLRVPEANQQLLQAIRNLAIPGGKQQVPQTQTISVPGSNLIQSPATPQFVVITPNLPNHSTTQIPTTSSPLLSYPQQMLQLPGSISNLPAPRTSSDQSSPPILGHGLPTSKLVSSGSTNQNLKKPGLLPRGPEKSQENLSSAKVLSTSANDSHLQVVGKTTSVISAENLKKNPPIANSNLQTNELNAQDMSKNLERSESATVSASGSSSPGCQSAAASPVITTRPGTSPKEVPLKLGAEIKPIPSDIPGPYKAYDHDVLIHVKYKYKRSRDKTRSMYIHDPIWRSMIKGYIRRELNYRHLAKQLYQMPELVNELQKLFLKQIDAECSVMCSPKTQTILRKLDPPNLENFKFADVLTELQKDAPLLRSVLEAVRSEKCPNQNLGIVAALLLYSRSTYLSAVHHVITKILHNGGADTKTIDLLSSMGLCSKSTSYFGNIKRYSARNNNEEYHNAFEDAQQCSDDNIDTEMDTSDETLSAEEDFDIKSKLKDKILKKISPENNKLKRKRIKRSAKMKNIQSCSASKKLKNSSPLTRAKMAASGDTSSVISNSQGTSSKTDKFKTAESCNESDVPLISAANDKNSAINSFCDNVEIHDGFDADSDTDLNEASIIVSST